MCEAVYSAAALWETITLSKNVHRWQAATKYKVNLQKWIVLIQNWFNINTLAFVFLFLDNLLTFRCNLLRTLMMKESLISHFSTIMKKVIIDKKSSLVYKHEIVEMLFKTLSSLGEISSQVS